MSEKTCKSNGTLRQKKKRSRSKKTAHSKQMICYFLLALFSIAFIIIASSITMDGAVILSSQTASVQESVVVKVTNVLDTIEDTVNLDETTTFTTTTITYEGVVITGESQGKTITATQSYDSMTTLTPTPARVGDLFFAYRYEDAEDYVTGAYIRLPIIAVALVLFIILFLLFARWRGLGSLFALLMSLLAVFIVFVPAILSGRNIYLWSLIVCAYTIAITPLFVGGFNRKSVAATLGCMGGVAIAAGLTLLLNSLARITGAADEDSMYVVLIREDPIDLRAVTFAAILIGALGAALDVSMSVASAVDELHRRNKDASSGALATSGMNVGRDIIGTQMSTLVLAYIGGSLLVVLLLIAYQSSVLEMLNLEMVVIEMLQSLVGSFTILFVIPATAVISAILLGGDRVELQSGDSSQNKKAGKTHRRTYHQELIDDTESTTEEFHIGH